MKSLNIYIKEGLRLSINKCIPIMSESLRIGINDSPEMLQPKSWYELRKIIEKRYKEFGPGTISNPIDFNDIDVSGMTKFFEDRGLFENTKFEYIDVSKWDVSNIKTMNSMFYDCNKLESIGDISNWNVSCVENMRWLFYDCKKLKSIGDLSNWDVSKVEYMYEMFNNSGIKNIPDWYEG